MENAGIVAGFVVVEDWQKRPGIHTDIYQIKVFLPGKWKDGWYIVYWFLWWL